MKPIQLMIVGAAKSGTTALMHYLAQHPDICSQIKQEMLYFGNEEEYAKEYATAYRRYFGVQAEQYQVLLAKHATLMYWPAAVQRLYEHNPEVQIVVILRNPVERAYSAYWQNRWRGVERRTFEEALAQEEAEMAEYVEGWGRVRRPKWKKLSACKYRGIYYPPVKNLIEVFGKQQVYVILTEDLRDIPNEVFKNIFQAVHLDATFMPDLIRRHNERKLPRSEFFSRTFAWFLATGNPVKKILRKFIPMDLRDGILEYMFRLNSRRSVVPPMRPETRQYLIEYFRPHNEKLSGLLNRDLAHWNQ